MAVKTCVKNAAFLRRLCLLELYMVPMVSPDCLLGYPGSIHESKSKQGQYRCNLICMYRLGNIAYLMGRPGLGRVGGIYFCRRHRELGIGHLI
jgi:hypothetical protein